MPQLVQGVYAALVVVPASRELEASVVVAANEVHDVATAWVARDLHRVIGHRAAVRQVVASFIRSDCFGSLPRFLLFDDGTVGFGELRGCLRLIAFTFPFRSASTFDAIRTDRVVLHGYRDAICLRVALLLDPIRRAVCASVVVRPLLVEDARKVIGRNVPKVFELQTISDHVSNLLEHQK